MRAPNLLSAAEAASLTRSGELSVEALARSCLERVAARDGTLHAWAHVDSDQVIKAARNLDASPVRGPLHGVPIGVKDVILTNDMPTGQNSPIYEGNRPGIDANCILTLRAAGALVFGKTSTTEFAATTRGGPARNPHDPARTPGGSSSGSGAVVGDFQVPLSLGTQTGGSTIRPASFCGIFALKPTWSAISREGLRMLSPSLDTLGLYARSIDDLDLLADVFHLRDEDTPRDVALNRARIGICRGAAWDRAEVGTIEAFESGIRLLRDAGAEIVEIALPAAFETLPAYHRIVIQLEGAASFRGEHTRHPGTLHPEFAGTIATAETFSRAEILAAYDIASDCRREFDAVAATVDAVLTPSVLGEAPLGQDTTGDASFNSVWTLLHVPVVNLPFFTGPAGLPVGLSLVAGRHADRYLLRTARRVSMAFAAGGSWDPAKGSLASEGTE